MHSDLDELLLYLKNQTYHHVGYPYNLKYDYSELYPFYSFTINNLGDPFINSNYKINSKGFEKEVCEFFADLYDLKNSWGYITTCGTEGNLYGLLLARETYPDGILYYSQDAHYSVAKAAHYFRIPHIIVNSQENGEMNYEDLKEKLDPSHPVLINLTIGTTFSGAVDDVDQILACLEAKNVTQFYIHCDAALGGLLLPYLKPEWFTFEKPIHSLAISGHKFIGTPFPCGVVLARRELAEHLAQEIEYIGSKDTTIMGSRNGQAVLLLWYAIYNRQHLFSLEVAICLENAHYLQERLQEAGIKTLLNPFSTTVVFEKPSQQLVEKWQLATKGEWAHFIVMQNHERLLIDHFVADMAKDFAHH